MHKILIFLSIVFAYPSLYGDSPSSPHRVLVSIVPFKFLVEQIAGDTCQVSSIVQKNYDPHTHEPSPRHMETLSQIQLWFRMGENFEHYYSKNISCPYVDINKNLPVIPIQTSCSHLNKFDTHTWLSPKNLKMHVQTIVEALSHHFPEHIDLYRINGEKLLSRLDILDQEITEITLAAKQKHILVAHGAFAYFCRDYAFTQHVLEKNNHSAPSPQDILRASQSIRDHNISSIIILRHAGKRSSAMLARHFNMRTVSLDPYAENVIDNLKTIATTISNL